MLQPFFFIRAIKKETIKKQKKKARKGLKIIKIFSFNPTLKISYTLKANYRYIPSLRKKRDF